MQPFLKTSYVTFMKKAPSMKFPHTNSRVCLYRLCMLSTCQFLALLLLTLELNVLFLEILAADYAAALPSGL